MVNKKQRPRATKAYRNIDFLTSPDARMIRIMAEFLEPLSRFRRHKIHDTIVFFGSSRAKPIGAVRPELEELKKKIAASKKPSRKLRQGLEKVLMEMRMAKYYNEAAELAKRLTRWARDLGGGNRFVIVTGGGPGIMEAANLGAARGGGKSLGLNISIPSEQTPNPYISAGYNFEFHYFFMRKFWFVFPASALVVFPGGFGTMDELIELLTLRQTKKITRKLPIVLYGKEYWDSVLSFKEMIRWGTISPSDLKLFHYSDSVDDAFKYLKGQLT